MLGSLRWNFAMGASGLLLTFIASLGHNGLAISSIRALYAFVALFILCFLFRFILFLIAGPPPVSEELTPEELEGLGGTVDISTQGYDDDLNELLKAQLDGGQRQQQETAEFRPLTPKKLVSAQNKDPEELAQAIRHLAEQPKGE